MERIVSEWKRTNPFDGFSYSAVEYHGDGADALERHITFVRDIEESYTEEWFLKGTKTLHRPREEGPAQITIYDPRVPTEMHEARSASAFYEQGVKLSEEDRTFADVMQKQPDAVAREFGWDVDASQESHPEPTVMAAPDDLPSHDEIFKTNWINVEAKREALRDWYEGDIPPKEERALRREEAEVRQHAAADTPPASVDVVAHEIQLMKEQEAREKNEREQETGIGR